MQNPLILIGRLPGRVVGAVRTHRAFAVLLLGGAAVRLATVVAYPPALMFPDSWAYTQMAWANPALGSAAERPSGYPAILKVLTLDQPIPAIVAVVQHLVGLGIGVLAYALLLRLGVRRVVALVVAGFVLLDAPTIALEQHLMPETFFALLLLAAFSLTIRAPRTPWALALAGAMLALAVATRTVALFAVPVWMLYLVWARSGRRAALAGVASMAALMLAYVGFYHHGQGTYGLSAVSGWFLYSRVGEMTECEGLHLAEPAARICRETEATHGRGVGFFLWDGRSPARRAFGGDFGRTVEERRRSDIVLKRLARSVVRERPLAYADMVAADFGRFFAPGVGSGGRSDAAITLPAAPRAFTSGFERRIHAELLGGYRPRVRPPSGLLRAYQSVVRTPRPLSALAGLLVVVAAVLALVGRGSRLPHRREAVLLGGSALAMLAGAVATSEFIVRYLVPVVPLLLCGGVLVAGDIMLGRSRAAS